MSNKLRNSVKGLINIKNNDNKCFIWCHVGHLNPLKKRLERITKSDKSMVNDLDYEGIKFPVFRKDCRNIEQKNNICINVFCYENDFYIVYISDQIFKDFIGLLLITDENKSHIKVFNRFMCNKTKSKTKKHFCRYCLQSFSSKKILIEHKENYLKINGKQSVKLKSSSIKFKNHFKQLAVPFKIYADFDCNLKGVKSNDRDKNTTYTIKHQDHILCSFAYKFVSIGDRSSKSVVLYRRKNAVNNLLKRVRLLQKK